MSDRDPVGEPESAARSTKRDDGPPTTIEDAPDTREDPVVAGEALAGLKAISRTIEMTDADPIPDPRPPASRSTSPSAEPITLKKAQGKVILAGAAAQADLDVDASVAPRASKPPASSKKKKRAIQKTVVDDDAAAELPRAEGGLSRTQPDPLPVEAIAALPSADDRAATKKRRPLPGPAVPVQGAAKKRKAQSPMSNPLVWVVGAVMVGALVAFGFFLSSSGGDTHTKTRHERSAKPASTPNVPLPEAPPTTPTVAQPQAPQPIETTPTAETPTPTPTPQPTITSTSTTPRPIPTPVPTPTPTPTPTTPSSNTPFPTFTIPSVLPSFPGIGTTPPNQSGSTGP